MKFLTFRVRDKEAVGLLTDDERNIIDLTAAGHASTMLDLIENFPERKDDIRLLLKSGAHTFPASQVTIAAPIPVPPRNIFCVGKNYYEHAKEFGSSGFDSGSVGGNEVPEYPIFFSKPPSAVIGPDQPIVSANDPFQSVDYEGEFAVVVGRRGRITDSDDPMSFVFGYTILNDVTSRELQKRHKQWLLGKGIDSFAPMGPTIVTAESLGNISELGIRTLVNGELRQAAHIRDLIFDVPALLKALGRSITLIPGDIIATGTPVGVGIGFEPPRYLRAGDKVRVEVDRLGALENLVA